MFGERSIKSCPAEFPFAGFLFYCAALSPPLIMCVRGVDAGNEVHATTTWTSLTALDAKTSASSLLDAPLKTFGLSLSAFNERIYIMYKAFARFCGLHTRRWKRQCPGRPLKI